jgi:hypothetical protein
LEGQANSPLCHGASHGAAFLNAMLPLLELLKAEVMPKALKLGVPAIAEECGPGYGLGFCAVSTFLQRRNHIPDHFRIVWCQLRCLA